MTARQENCGWAYQPGHNSQSLPALHCSRSDQFSFGWRASDIDADLVNKFIDGEQKGSLGSGTINRSIFALKRMFSLARKQGKIRVPHFPMLKEAAPRLGSFERGDYDKLFIALPDYLRLPLAMGYFTGMREGEILGVRWNQVDFLSGVIHLRAGETKNDEGREIPIVPEWRDLLDTEYAKPHPDCEHVCSRLDRLEHRVRIQSFRKACCAACVRADLGKWDSAQDPTTGNLCTRPRANRKNPAPKVKMVYKAALFHDLRRSGVRNLVRAGTLERAAMGISGDKTRSIFERYNIVSPSDVREAGRKLAQFHAEQFDHISNTECTTMQQNDSLIN